MIIDALRLKTILDFILHIGIKEIGDSLNLEISRLDEFLIIAANYGDCYYISYTINISNELNNDNYDFNNLIIPKNGVIKLFQMINIWPKCTVKIETINNLISLEIVEHGKLVRENPVYVECFFEQDVNNYAISPPPMEYNCSINSKNLKQMLEFCNTVNDGIFLEIKEKSLSISSSNSSIATLVDLEELIRKPSKKIKLSYESNYFIISFLNKIVNKYNLVYLLFIEDETAFSIKVGIDDLTTIQIYTEHL